MTLQFRQALAEYVDAALCRLDMVKTSNFRVNDAVERIYDQLVSIQPAEVDDIPLQPLGTWQRTPADWLVSAADIIGYAARTWADPVIDAPTFRQIADELRDLAKSL